MRRYRGIQIKDRSDDYRAGHRRAMRACVAWLHERAQAMNDPKATAILNSAAFDLGNASAPEPLHLPVEASE